MSTSPYTAGPHMLGYFYQARYALLLLWQAGKEDLDGSLSIEKFDDVTFEDKGTPKELIQLKHHTNPKNLGDSSNDLWKTVFIWIQDFKENSTNLEKKYTLITTSQAADGSIADKLTPNSSKRDVEAAAQQLQHIASTSQSQENKKYYSSFLGLTNEEQTNLLNSVYILDGSPNIVDTQSEILKEITYVTNPNKKEPFYERLEGWWFKKVINHLAGGSNLPITNQELVLKVDALREEFVKDNLPIDFLDYDLTEDELNTTDKNFIEQLKLITAHNAKLRYAIQDYYKAYYQRSKWLREGLVSPDELVQYEKALMEEWHRLFIDMEERLGENPTEDTLVAEGSSLYSEVSNLNSEIVFIKPKCKQPYIMRGSYHILADDFKVGWRADFLDKLKHLIGQAREKMA